MIEAPSRRAGVLLVDKPEGPTSHDVVNRARRALGTRRIGHTGTLDPFASGLLQLCVGSATRLAEYLTGLDKGYHAVARLGQATTTADRTGEVVWESDAWRDLREEEIRAVFEAQLGEIEQLPPAYSAKKIAGVRAYELARRGAAVELEPARVRIDRIEIVDISLPEVTFEVDCSSGTYIRSMAQDLGAALGTGAHLVSLRRTRIGAHRVEDAVPATALDDPERRESAWLTPLEAVAHLPRLQVGPEEAQALGHGVRVPVAGRRPEGGSAGEGAGGPVVFTYEGELLAVGTVEGGELRARKVFARD